jgi:hypothetical protein
MDEQRMTPVEQRLMMLGAALVNARLEINGEEAAHIVADAMERIDLLQKELFFFRKQNAARAINKARARRPR